MTENEFDQDIDQQVKSFREHDAQVDRLNKDVLALEQKLMRQAERLDYFELQQKQWDTLLNHAGFHVGPQDWYERNELTEDIVQLALPRLAQLVRLGEQFEYLRRAIDSNEVVRSQWTQLAASIKLLDLQVPNDDIIVG